MLASLLLNNKTTGGNREIEILKQNKHYKGGTEMMGLKKLNTFDRIMAAITFAEAGEHKTAIRLMEQGQKKKQKRLVKKSEKRADQRPVLRA